MFDAFLCYVVNTYPEIAGLCTRLDGVVRTIVNTQSIDTTKECIEGVLPDVERFLLERDRAFPTSPFTIPNPPDRCIDLLEPE